jgi:hypothetical protein
MNAQLVTCYPSLQRRLITQRRARALFLTATTQHVRTRTVLVTEVARAAGAAVALVAWCVSLLLIGG